MKNFFPAVILLLTICGYLYPQLPEGNYYLGEQKVSIVMDYNSYYILYEKEGVKRSIQYEENTPENDQVWTEFQEGKRTGTLVLKSDYSSGIYTDYNTNIESYIKKRD